MDNIWSLKTVNKLDLLLSDKLFTGDLRVSSGHFNAMIPVWKFSGTSFNFEGEVVCVAVAISYKVTIFAIASLLG